MTATSASDGTAPVAIGADSPRPSRGRRIRGLEPEQRRQERRRQLLDSALELFATQGYANTSIEQICQTAYVGFKGFYDEFATKEALFLALYDRLVRQVGQAVIEAVDAMSTPSGPVRDVLEVFVREVLDDPRVAQILFVEAAGLSATVEAHRRATYRRFADFLHQAYIVRSLASGADAPGGLNPSRISLGLVGAVVEVMVDWLVDPEPDGLDELIDDLESYCQVLLAGIAAR